MATVAMRRLTIDGRQFLWRRRHLHARSNPRGVCAEVLRVYAEGNKRSPLEIFFTDCADWRAGYPQAGIVWSTSDSRTYNLNRPAVVEALVRCTLGSAWDPDSGTRPVTVDDGIHLLERSRAPTGSD